MIQHKVRDKLGYVMGSDGCLNPGGGTPFYRVVLDTQSIDELLKQLDTASQVERAWFTITVTQDNLDRLRIIEARVPAFEKNAPPNYVRGTVLRVSGQKSLNVDFSGPVGAQLLAQQLRRARDEMKEYVEFRIPSRKRDLVFFVPDVALPPTPTSELDKLSMAGEKLTSEVWPTEDFSDWEGFDD
ncbi:MAG: hypothetical protein ACYTF1_08290 [Planctomycetota bacterium]|jgi:hypothetical protein